MLHLGIDFIEANAMKSALCLIFSFVSVCYLLNKIKSMVFKIVNYNSIHRDFIVDIENFLPLVVY